MKNVLLVLCVVLSGWTQAATIYVNQAATGANNGSSWANAYTDLSDAMAMAIAGDEIWVATGSYLPTRDRNYIALAAGARQDATFKLPPGVSTYGGFAGTETLLTQRDPSVNICELSGDHLGNDNGVLTYTNPLLSDNSFTVVLAQGLTAGDVLDGFTILKGASRPPTSVFSIHDRLNGAGLYVNGPCDLAVNQCVFEQNTASENGGAIMVYSLSIAAPVTLDINNTVILQNRANKNGGGLAIHANPDASMQVNLMGVEIDQNAASVNGAAIAQEANKNATSRAFLENVIIKDNTGGGGTIYNDAFQEGTITFEATNALIVGNSVGKVGGVMYNDARSRGNCQILFQNCTIAENITPGNNVFCYSAAYQGGSCTSTFNNSILHQNASSNFGAYGGATYQLDYCLIDQASCPANTTCGSNMFYNQNPGFVNQAAGDFSTNSTSFGTDQGDNAGVATVLTDLAGNARIQNGTVDLGAYEAAFCPSILHVKATATGANNGTTWADAYNDLQDALTFARNNSCVQEIWVASGLYTPHPTDRTIFYDLVNDVDMYGSFPNTGNPTMADRDVATYQTVLSGEINSSSTRTDNSYHVFRANYFSNYTIFDGFNIESAYYKVTQNPNLTTPSYGAAQWFGPGRISNCTFSVNFSFYYAGALRAQGVEIDKCTFQNNEAPWRGGALEALDNNVVKNCRFYNNGSAGGGAINIDGVSDYYNCIFKGNFARTHYYWNHVTGNQFSDQYAQGGAIYHNGYSAFFTTNVKMINCTFYGNYGVNAQGGTFATEASAGNQLQFFNCIIQNSSVSGNQCEDAIFGTGLFNSYCEGDIGTAGTPGQTVDFYDCNVQSTSSSQFHWYLSANFYGNTQTANPQFNNPGSNDFRLGSSSPSINAGNNAHVPASVTTDIAGNVRIDGTSVDMGAYENFPGSQLRVAYVNLAAVGANNGTSWADAFNNLQDALKAANEANSTIEELWLAEGTYYPSDKDNRELSFTISKGLKLYGGFKRKGSPKFSNRSPEKYPTILSGDIGKKGVHSDNSYHILHILAKHPDIVGLDGILLKHGNANGVGDYANGAGIYQTGTSTLQLAGVNISECQAMENGGGICLLGGNLEMENGQMLQNTSQKQGAALYMALNASATGAVKLLNVGLEENSAINTGSIVYVMNGTLGYNQVNMARNEADRGLVYVANEEVAAQTNSHHFANSLFAHNVVYNGSLIRLQNQSKASQEGHFTNCSFVGNESYNSNGAVLHYESTTESPYQVSFANSLVGYNHHSGFVLDPENPTYQKRPVGLCSWGKNGSLSFYDCAIPGDDVHQENPGASIDRTAYGVMQYLGDAEFSTDFLQAYAKGVVNSETQHFVDAGNKAHLSTNMPHDVWGNSRVQGSSVDIGAIEFSSTSSIHTATVVEEIKLYPNPSSTTTMLATTESLSSLVVYNMQGQKVLMDYHQPSNFIDVSTWAGGVYLVDAETTTGKKFRGKLRVDD